MPTLPTTAVAVPSGTRASTSPATQPVFTSSSRVIARTQAWVALGVIVLGSFAARLIAAVAHPTPQYFQDEYVYAALARSIAHGRLTVRGGHTGFPALVEPFLAAAAWWPNDPALAYRITQGMHALVVSFAAVPVYLLARRLGVSTRDALLAAVATVALPSLGWSAYLTADAVGLTVALCSVLAAVVALDRPTFSAQALFLGLALASALTRVQYVFLPAAFLIAALVVERGNIRTAARVFRPTLVAVGLMITAGALAGPSRVLGMYAGVRSFHLDLTGIAHWVAVDSFLLALATGVVILPGASAGLVRALGASASRAERAFGSVALASLCALFLEASFFSTNGNARFLERYLALSGPLLILGLCLAPKPGRARIWAMAVGSALVVALMRFPVSGYAAGSGKQDSPLLWAVYWLEGQLGTGTGAGLIAAGAALLTLFSIVVLRFSRRAVPILLAVSIIVGSAASLAGTLYDLTRDAAARTTFLPSDMRWVDHAGLGRRTTVLVTPGTDPPVVSAHLFWNLDLGRVVLLERAARVDAFRSPGAVIAGDGTILADGAPVSGPVLVEEYAAVAELQNARLITRTPATSLWLPASRARISLLAEGRYLDGWLSFASRIRSWPSAAGGTETLRFALSLPPNAPSQQLTLRGPGIDREVVVPSGGTAAVALRINRSQRTTVTLACSRGLKLPDSRIVCAQMSIPELVQPIKSR